MQRDPDCRCGGIHAPFWERPGLSRRRFFRLAGAGLTGYYFANVADPPEVLAASGGAARGTATHCIFILLAGAPSHVDTFDLKEGPWTPAEFAPTSYGGVRFPQGLLPKMAEHLPRVSIVRSVRAWALVHGLAQRWSQIGRNPTSSLGRIAPHIGAIVALETAPQRRPGDILPGFVSLNASGTQAGAGYLSSVYAPFAVNPSQAGLANTAHPDGADRFNLRWEVLHSLDDSLRRGSPLGRPPEDWGAFAGAAKALMYNPAVDQVFQFSAEERDRYGASAFGDACLVARNLVQQDKGTRFVQITQGGWDHHSNIYQPGALFARSTQLDNGLGTLLGDLAASGALNRTLVVVCGEFGRTVGGLNSQQGRDHYFQQFALFAGGGLAGGRVIGATDATGSYTTEPGWSRDRDIKAEDIEATIYSALGIDWTTIRYDDPFNRGFEYVPQSRFDVYGPVDELWG